MENNKYLEEFKIDLVKQHLQGKQKKTSAKNTGSRNRRCGDGYAVRRPHTEIVGGQRYRGCRRGIHRNHHVLKGGTQQQNHNQHHERICENIQERVFDPVPRFKIGQSDEGYQR